MGISFNTNPLQAELAIFAISGKLLQGLKLSCMLEKRRLFRSIIIFAATKGVLKTDLSVAKCVLFKSRLLHHFIKKLSFF